MEQYPVTKAEESRFESINYDKLGFGAFFTDHVFMMDYIDGEWKDPRIVPNAPMSIEPANLTLHYGQAVFEGLKAFRHPDDSICTYRPDKHYARLCRSCQHLCIPEPPVDVVMRGQKQLISLEKKFVPRTRGHSLYIRPFIFATDNLLGVQPSSTYRLIILLSPVAAYYPEGMKPVKLYVSDEYSRAAQGGLGMAKTPANYAASLLPAKIAKEKGFTQVLWLDAAEHKYIEEVGTMNIFFKINGEIITPPLSGNTILSGVTRMSVIEYSKKHGLPITERRITIDEIFEYHKNGQLEEVFGTGTAAVISPVGKITFKEQSIEINNMEIGPTAQNLYDSLTAIHYGEAEDPFGWIQKICD
jgi:branched-chain amino acid aminotransferase